MPIQNTLKDLWSLVKKPAHVKLTYRNRCVETIRLCRSLKNVNFTEEQYVLYTKILNVASSAIDYAARDEDDADPALTNGEFERFDNMVKWFCNCYHSNIKNGMSQAKERDIMAKEKLTQANERLTNAEERLTRAEVNISSAKGDSCIATFIVASGDPVQNDVIEDGYTFEISRHSTLPELAYRFQRKRKNFLMSDDKRRESYRPLRVPHFYAYADLCRNVNERVIRPLAAAGIGESNNTQDCSQIWVCADRPEGHYHLTPPGMSGFGIRIRSVSKLQLKVDGRPVLIYRDMFGNLSTGRSKLLVEELHAHKFTRKDERNLAGYISKHALNNCLVIKSIPDSSVQELDDTPFFDVIPDQNTKIPQATSEPLNSFRDLPHNTVLPPGAEAPSLPVHNSVMDPDPPSYDGYMTDVTNAKEDWKHWTKRGLSGLRPVLKSIYHSLRG